MTRPKFWPKPIPRLFFPRPNFSKQRLFIRDQICQNRNFYPRPNSSKPKPRLFIGDQILRDFLSETKFSETETFFPRPNSPKPKPSENWRKSQNRDVSKSECHTLFVVLRFSYFCYRISLFNSIFWAILIFSCVLSWNTNTYETSLVANSTSSGHQQDEQQQQQEQGQQNQEEKQKQKNKTNNNNSNNKEKRRKFTHQSTLASGPAPGSVDTR